MKLDVDVKWGVSPLQVTVTAAAVSAGHGGRETRQILQGGGNPDLLMPNGE